MECLTEFTTKLELIQQFSARNHSFLASQAAKINIVMARRLRRLFPTLPLYDVWLPLCVKLFHLSGIYWSFGHCYKKGNPYNLRCSFKIGFLGPLRPWSSLHCCLWTRRFMGSTFGMTRPLWTGSRGHCLHSCDEVLSSKSHIMYNKVSVYLATLRLSRPVGSDKYLVFNQHQL